MINLSLVTIPQNPFPSSSDNVGGSSYELPIASTTELGGIKVGSGLAINAETGVLINNYSLPVASDEILGGVKVGSGLSINSETGVLSSSYSLPIASDEILGGVKIGDGLTIDANGVMDVNIKTNGGLILNQDNEILLDDTVIDYNTYNFSTTAPETRIGSLYDGTNSHDVYRRCYNIGADIPASQAGFGIGNMGNFNVAKLLSVRVNDGYCDVTTSFRIYASNNMLYADNLVASAFINPKIIIEYIKTT